MTTLQELDAVALRETGIGGNDFSQRFPVFKQLARTGATRFNPTLRGDKFGRVFTYWFDHVSLQEYDEMRLDGQCRAGLALLKLPIQRARYIVSCESTEISAFVQEVLKPIWPSFIRQALLALDFGFSVFETQYQTKYNWRITETQGQLGGSQERIYPFATAIKKMMHMDPTTLWLLGYRRTGEFAGFKQFTPYDVVVPESKSFLFSNDKEFEELYGVSRLKPCFPYWFFKKMMYENTNLFYETYTTPTRKGRYPEGQSEGEDGSTVNHADLMMELLDNLRNDGAVALPSMRYENGEPMWDIEYMESGRSGGDHIQYIDHLNYMILKSLLVPQLAIETGASGTYNLGQEQIDFFLQSEEALGEQFAEAVNEQLIKPLIKYNFGPRAPQAALSFAPMTKGIRDGLAEIMMQTLGQGRPVPTSDGSMMVPDWQYMAETLGVPVKILSQDDFEAYQQADQTINPPMPEDMPYGGGPGGSGGGEGGQPPQGGQPPSQANMSEADEYEWVIEGKELVWAPR